MFQTYQFDGDSIVSDQVDRQVNPAVGSLAKDVEQLVSFAKNPRNLPHDVYELVV